MSDKEQIEDPTGLRAPYNEAEWIEDDAALRKVRQVRLTIMANHLKDGIPTDSDGFEQMHKNLQEIDKGAFKSKQLKQEEKSSEAQAKLAMEISNVLAKQLGSRDIFVGKEGEVEAEIPQPTHLLGKTEPVPGELKVGDDTSSYEVFSNTVGKALEEARKAGNTEAE